LWRIKNALICREISTNWQALATEPGSLIEAMRTRIERERLRASQLATEEKSVKA